MRRIETGRRPVNAGERESDLVYSLIIDEVNLPGGGLLEVYGVGVSLGGSEAVFRSLTPSAEKARQITGIIEKNTVTPGSLGYVLSDNMGVIF